MGFNFLDHFGFWSCTSGRVGLAGRVHKHHGTRDALVIHDQQSAVVVGGVEFFAVGAQSKILHTVVAVTTATCRVVIGAIIFVGADG